MHTVPPASELQSFVGDAASQILLDPFQIKFAFKSGRRLVAAFRVEHIEPDGKVRPYGCVASEGPPLLLHRLLGRPVVAVERDDLSFTLRFDDASALRIHSDIGPCESAEISLPDGSCVAF